MKYLILIIFLSGIVYSQDYSDGRIKNSDVLPNMDVKGSGSIEQVNLQDLINQRHYKLQAPQGDNALTVNYSQYWSSPSGAFGNCWDGAVGYFDNDTLLDIAGYTFSPNSFYIWEQSPTSPDSFALVYTYTKVEFGGFGPLAVGDVDGDGKVDFVLSDFSTLSRIYVISNTGNNTYVSRETQNTLTFPADNMSVQALLIGDLNKNGQKEIICMRGTSSPTTAGMIRIYEHTGSPGSFSFTNLFTYNTVTYLFGKSGIGDSDGNGWDEVFLTYGGYDVFTTNIRKIQFDSASGTFQHQQFAASTLGFPASYNVLDVNNDGVKELISTNSSNNRAACYIYRSTGVDQYTAIDSIFEPQDPNTMMTADIKILTGDVYPTIVAASFGGKVYMYQYDGAHYPKIFENDNYPGSAIRRIYWLPWSGYNGYFNTWSSSSSNGTFYLFKKDSPNGIINNQTPVRFALNQNYPNPFNPSTIISYQLATSSFVKLTIYSIEGQIISDPVNRIEEAGTHSVSFSGENLSSGIYFYRFETDGIVEIKKMVLVK